MPLAACAVEPLESSSSRALAPSNVTAVVTEHADALAARVTPYASILEPVDRPLALPADPVQALIDSTAALAALVGVPQEPGGAIRDAQLEPVIAGRLANVVLALDACTRATNAALDGQDLVALNRGVGFDARRFAALPGCATVLAQATRDLHRALSTDAAASSGPTLPTYLDVWPVFVLDRRDHSRVYVNDYLLIADVGGDDRYYNNGGSNVVDLRYAPSAVPVPSNPAHTIEVGPARGCQNAIAGLTRRDCVPVAAVLLDLTGNDWYGQREVPVERRDVDWACRPPGITPLPSMVLRMVTNAVGLAGVGLLVDVAGNDRYISKTVSNGAGHVGGIGVLQDLDGDDVYLSIRNSQGFGLVGGLGLIQDAGGDDVYAYYMPPGGVIDDEDMPAGQGPFCDATPRYMQGTGNVAGVGMLLDDDGTDAYRGAAVDSFGWPVPTPSGAAGSLGFGNNEGVGVFLDRGADDDTYVIVTPRGNIQRADNTTLAPNGSCAPGATCTGLFRDE